MQLKRETDFAIRILYCLYRNCADREFGNRLGLTLTEIAAQTKVPKTIAGRICEYLLDKKMIHFVPWEEYSEKSFHATSALLAFSLKDVVEAVEGHGRLFAIFDKNSNAFAACRDQLLMVEEKVDEVLEETTLGMLFERKEADANGLKC